MSLEVHGLTRRLQTVSGAARQGELVFEALTLRVDKGERLFIVGPSGSGKSLLLRALAGLDEPQVCVIPGGGSRDHGVPPLCAPPHAVWRIIRVYSDSG